MDKSAVPSEEVLNRFLDLAATNATGANPYPSCRPIDQRANRLQIRAKYTFRPIVGVAHGVARGMMFTAQVANSGHNRLPCEW